MLNDASIAMTPSADSHCSLSDNSTKSDDTAHKWNIDDPVVRLRRWGTDDVYDLHTSNGDITVGSSAVCFLQLRDPSKRISRLHARITYERHAWRAIDLGSKNGITQDGSARSEVIIEPGVELGIAGVTLVAESRRSIEMRAFLSRVLGWRQERAQVVDLALRSIRMAAAHRVALVLRGEGDMVPLAHALHMRALGADRPFVACDPRRHQGGATVRSAENYETGMAAFEVAAGGSLCIRSQRPPRDFPLVLAALRDPDAHVQLMVCAHSAEDHFKPYLFTQLEVPELSGRQDELDRIITEYAEDAGAGPDGLTPGERAWVRQHSASSLPDIEKATMRLVAIRQSRNLSSAAQRLGMASVSLARWFGRRRMPE